MVLTNLINSVKETLQQNTLDFDDITPKTLVKMAINFIENLQKEGFHETIELDNHMFVIDIEEYDLRFQVFSLNFEDLLVDIDEENVFSFVENIIHLLAQKEQESLKKDLSPFTSFLHSYSLIPTLYTEFLNLKLEIFKERYSY